ncbi:MAG: KEOPS complex subunit Cgi121 [Nitrosopumilaceae archaeon]
MIQVKLLGGAKKSFSADMISIDKDNLTIAELIDYLQKTKPENTPDLDVNNLLVVVNGVDSSAIEGKITKLKNNDVVSIIPIIHGGSSRSTIQISKYFVEILEIKPNKTQSIDFLNYLRKKHPDLVIQGISPKYILSKSHAKKILKISIEAQNSHNMLSRKLETDILMRFACTTQISKAISKAGIKSKQSFTVIALGKKLSLENLYSELKPYLSSKNISLNNTGFLKNQFKISNKQIDSVYSKKPLEDLLAEKAAVLF